MSSGSARERSQRNVDQAYEVQVAGGLEGMLKGGLFGVGATTLAHYGSPVFRRQTLAFKGFLVSVCVVTGMVFGAENALLDHEGVIRKNEALIRKRARLELARQGLIGTETEISKWKDENGY
ncbi:hypothetical protein DL96DRAFT_1457164 [Flagelloscypha sp. PMI_526]|nr:hypothetical protein DL96DRAFT_1457164 [Flagelloscypha sp. PMI_526]